MGKIDLRNGPVNSNDVDQVRTDESLLPILVIDDSFVEPFDQSSNRKLLFRPPGLLFRSELTSCGSQVAAIFLSRQDLQLSKVQELRALYPYTHFGTFEQPEISEMRYWMRTAQVAFGLKPNSSRFHAWLNRSIGDWNRDRAERAYQRDLGTRNRQLQNLQEQLEKRVNDRTAYLKNAEQELYQRMSSARELVRFLKELSQMDQLEDIMSLISREVKGFHQVRPPMLAFVSSESGPQVLFRRGGGAGSSRQSQRMPESTWTSKSVKRLWPKQLQLKYGDHSDQEFWAQELARPSTRILSIPLSSTQTSSGLDHRATLIFEYDYDDAGIQSFISHLAPRLEAVAATLDRILFNQESRSSAKQWEATFDGLPDPIALVDGRGQIIRMNRAFHDIQDALKEIENPLPSPRSVVGRLYKLKGSTYQLRPFQMSMDDQLATGSAVWVYHFTSVGDQVDVRSRAIQNEKMAAIGLMAGNIAHELNNPLAGLRSLAQVLSVQPNFPKQVIDDLKQIEFAADRSSAIIRDLLGFSGGGLKQTELFNVVSAIDWSINMAKTAIHEHSLEWTEPDTDFIVEGDPHLLAHVLFNIINNACQAMQSMGRLRLEVKQDRDWVEILIADSGPGINVDLASRIFEPFFTTKNVGHGTGLGLSMSRSVIEAMRGEIQLLEAPSTDLSGAHFLIRLPLADKGPI